MNHILVLVLATIINFEKEPVSLIKCYFMFVNNNNEIVKATKEETELIVGDDVSLLSKLVFLKS